MYIECPNCEECFDVEPDLECGSEDLEDECPKCGKEFVYDMEFEPIAENVREMPECRMRNHVYGEKVDRGPCFKSRCVYCDKTKYDYKDDLEG